MREKKFDADARISALEEELAVKVAAEKEKWKKAKIENREQFLRIEQLESEIEDLMSAGIEAVAGRSRANTAMIEGATKCPFCDELQMALDESIVLADQLKARCDQSEAQCEMLKHSATEMNAMHESIPTEPFRRLLDCDELALRYKVDKRELGEMTIVDMLELCFVDESTVSFAQQARGFGA